MKISSTTDHPIILVPNSTYNCYCSIAQEN
jgi:hypothetical protein